MAASFPLSPFFETSSFKHATMSAPISSLHDLLQHQHSPCSYINNKPGLIIPLSAGAAPNPNSISPNTTTTTTTIAFSVLKPKLPRKKPDPTSLAKTTTGVIPPCTECGKRFSSWKALFGHMRCHPERQWRGINPPAQFRRGAGGGGGPLARFTSEEYEVASSLILLANGPSPPNDCGPTAGLKRRWEDAQSAVAALGCAHLSSSSSHKCSICLKGFSSGQALGGHMRCHWDTKLEVEDNSFAAAAAAAAGDLVLLDLNLPPPGAEDINSINETAAVDATVLDLRLGM